MTDPDRTAEERYATVPLPPAGPQRDALLRDAVAVGSLDQYFENLLQTPAREAREQELLNHEQELAAQELQQSEARATAVQMIADMVDNLSARMDGFEKARSLAAKRAEAERKEAARRKVQHYLDQLPDPDEPSQYPAPLLTPDPRAQDQGDLPNELLKGAPPPLGTEPEPDPAELGGPKDPHQVPQPISISLNSEGV
jgi:hypothetical protein